MSGISDVEPEMMPPMEEMSHEDHLQRAGSRGGDGFYSEGHHMHAVPPMGYAQGHDLADGPTSEYYHDDSAAARYAGPSSTADSHRYEYRPDLDEPIRPQVHDEAYADDSDPFTYATPQTAPTMTKSSSRWSG